ncbi:Protein of unknown function (DUF559) [Desulfitobacterium hafniense]|uniref:Restriction endonuclease type II-like domain-containing protein n=1 Tax=Desulfitobacterium hafniense TaxID=49338 RepID=A0A098AUY2_DESHA|nr:DUF559 domain-containing protein [Desulfitobacterium hafniense]CDV96386.1 Protein of unknown function (DUF559) [Desulfitobacterium hafniense]
MNNVTNEVLQQTKEYVSPSIKKILISPNVRLRDMWDIATTSFISRIGNLIQKAESPIEEVFGLCLYHMIDTNRCNFQNIIFDVIQQRDVGIDGKKYRLDYLIRAYNVNSKEFAQYVIECDGHEFHEKTKDQARRDKERDRVLTRNGYKILRFTGSEIIKDPLKYGLEVIETVVKLLGDKPGGE